MLLRMRIYDTMSNTIRDLKPKDPSKVSIYACGPTVQDVPHLGHARTALTYDVLKRYLVWAGFEVFLVSNITDIDDVAALASPEIETLAQAENKEAGERVEPTVDA